MSREVASAGFAGLDFRLRDLTLRPCGGSLLGREHSFLLI